MAELTDAEVDERLAKALGWREGMARGRQAWDCGTFHIYMTDWKPTENRSCIADVEAEISRRGLQAQYELQLMAWAGSDGQRDGRCFFRLATAPAAVRARAALRVLTQTQQEG